jgi:2-polyprenyl-6-methoxyphenol hydroxylase-like FAD-dependent oxidoreductase
MTRSFDYDVAVVGASIAGCTAATLFARAGLRVALIERARAEKSVCFKEWLWRPLVRLRSGWFALEPASLGLSS